MPIHFPLKVRPLSDEAFEHIDRLVMTACYASQNILGRLQDERVYENDIAGRLRAEGIAEVHTQVPVSLTHENFSKIYRLDLVVEQMVYELKTVTAFTPDHVAQAIHYAALTGTDRVKLVNFRSEKVMGKLLGSPFWRVKRRKVTIAQDRWEPLSEECANLVRRMSALVADWGAFLETTLYEEALVHFCGGEAHCLRRLPVCRDGVQLGTHRVLCHAGDVGFLVTSFSERARDYESHLCRLVQCLPLRGLQWINLNHAELQFITLLKDKVG